MNPRRQAEFRRFAQLREAKISPLYSHLAACIAEKADRYSPFLNAIPPHEQAPNLLFAAVHLLLQSQPASPLADYYSSIHKSALSPDSQTFNLFSDYCLQNQDQIISILRHRRTQTNEVRRGLALLPAINVIQTFSEQMPLILIEIGCSAGLNLIWDQYRYVYYTESGKEFYTGCLDSSLLLKTNLKGHIPPLITPTTLILNQRIGIDVNPLNIHSTHDTQWLDALIWPEHHDRRKSLHMAISIAKNFILDLRKGDALELLPGIVGELSADCAPVFFHTYVTQQLTPKDRAFLPQLINRISSRFRLAFHLWHERGKNSSFPELVLRHIQYGNTTTTSLLAFAEAHVRWLEWKAMENCGSS